MSASNSDYFDNSAANWDNEPRRIALMKAVGEAILREAQPNNTMDVLDYGCGTGLIGLFLLPYVRSVTGADSSPGMLEVLYKKIHDSRLKGMKAIQLNLEDQAVPKDRFHMVLSSMVMHHIAEIGRVLRAFHDMLLPGGILCIADLDKEPGVFHSSDAAASVHHLGFDRNAFKEHLTAAGFADIKVVAVHVVRKPANGGEFRDFPVFLMVGRKLQCEPQADMRQFLF
jgi:ubiquinone/menaquinone biosynthesis C-methylase UbiE